MPTPHQFFSRLAQRLTFGRGSRQGGFVLPVAILIVLVLSLVTVGLLSRSTQRNFQVQVERASQVVTGQVNTAVDRARAKINFLINDTRLPRSSPSDSLLAAALINADVLPTDDNYQLPYDPTEPYRLPGENQFLISSEFSLPNPDPDIDESVDIEAAAWWFDVDTDNDGNNDAITAYTIFTRRRAPREDNSDELVGFEEGLTDEERATRLMIRSGPLQGSASEACVDVATETTQAADAGDWFRSQSRLYKPFQVYAVTIPAVGATGRTRALSALQFQQDRERRFLNKWGAFSRGDIEFDFTPQYNWNGAIYAGGSLFYRYLDGADTGFTAYLISSHESCFYMPVDNSEIRAFGELVAGIISEPNQQGVINIDRVQFDAHPGTRLTIPTNFPALDNNGKDSVVLTDGAPPNPESIALDPLSLHLSGTLRNREDYTRDASGWGNSSLNVTQEGRIEVGGFAQEGPERLTQECPPYVDDVYRADDRFGPKPSYDRPPLRPEEGTGCNISGFSDPSPAGFGAIGGESIPQSAENKDLESLTQLIPPEGSPDKVGLDGYWERRARRDGLRVIVGQRLELTRSDSLPLPITTPPVDPRDIQPILMTNQARQRLTLRDNPAAVQATAVYHYTQNNGEFPVACLATVVHPGSAATLRRASSFPSGNQRNELGINFFAGEGTNTWEYDPAPLQAALESGTTSPLWLALRNLAIFAGDPRGAFPPVQEPLTNLIPYARILNSGDNATTADPLRIHPDPVRTAFGNFSELRRITERVFDGASYESLSLADKTTVQTATCMIGMLADNILRIQEASADPSPDPDVVDLAADIADSRDGDLDADGVLLDSPKTQRVFLPLRYLFPTGDFREVDSSPTSAERLRSGIFNSIYNYANFLYKEIPNLAAIRLQPRESIGNWILPHRNVGNCPAAGSNSSAADLISVGGTCYRVPFKDSSFYDGREVMAVRALNVDLALLTDNVDGQNNPQIGNDTWLPDGSENNVFEGGVLYAFREDAVREDAIARPTLGTETTPQARFDGYEGAWRANTARGELGNRVMNAGQAGRTDAANPVGDPPIEASTLLSPKPVDYFADPDRRPFGFRLRNGAILQRGGFNADDSVFGLSFISDNPVYIQGDFNLHRSSANSNLPGTLLEEFDIQLQDGNDYTRNKFYNQRTNNQKDDRFARADLDSWRPTDILGDSVNILSANFCDGSLDDALIQDGSLNGGSTAYNSARSVTATGQASSPRRVVDYGCTDVNMTTGASPGNALGNTSFLNQALVINGNNWPSAVNPNTPNPSTEAANAGVRALAADGSQDLGDRTNQPGQADVFARDTISRTFTTDTTLGSLIPARRDVRPPDPGYTSFPARISSLGNPVYDTSRWLQVAAPGRCPVPDGSGLVGEYYNGWITSPRDLYQRDTGFETNNPPDFLSPAAENNLRFLRGVRWPDPIFPFQGVPNNLATIGAPWSLVRNAVTNPASLTPPPDSIARYRLTNFEPQYPFTQGGFRYEWGSSNSNDSHSPLRRTLHSNTACTGGTLNDSFNSTCNDPPPPRTPDIKRLFWMPTCVDPIDNTTMDQASQMAAAQITNNPAEFNFRRNCWRRRSGGNNSGNQNGNDYFAVRWIGEFYPMYSGVIPHRFDTDDGGRITIRNNPNYSGPGVAPLDLNNQSATFVRADDWRDKGLGSPVVLNANVECADPNLPSPYLIELQQYEAAGGAGANLSIQDPGGFIEQYDLRYLKPITPVNRPCIVPNGSASDDLTEAGIPVSQLSCDSTLNCAVNTPNWPACPVVCTPTQVTQTRQPTLPAGCPGPLPTAETRTITCNPPTQTFTAWTPAVPACPNPTCTATTITQFQTRQRNDACAGANPTQQTRTDSRSCSVTQPTTGAWSAWEPACSTANGGTGTNVNQTRTRTITNFCPSTSTTTQTENRSQFCPAVCNYGNFSPWSPGCPSSLPVCPAPAVTQTRTRTLNAATSSGSGCAPSQTETQQLTGCPCFDPSSWPGDSDPSPLDSVIQASVPASGGRDPLLSRLGLPSLSKVLGSMVNWVFGEPAYAAQNGVAAGLGTQLATPQQAPGIRPADGGAQALPSPLPSDLDQAAIARRNVFMSCPSDTPNFFDLGYWVPGVFRPNFNTSFRYTGYTGTSIPSTLRFAYGSPPPLPPSPDIPAPADLDCIDVDANGTLSQAERQAGRCQFRPFVDPAATPLVPLDQVFDRDPLFGFDANVDGDNLLSTPGAGDIQPQMRITPFARVRNDDNNPNQFSQQYATNTGYSDGYYIDDRPPNRISNGLCFYVRAEMGQAAIKIDQDGRGSASSVWLPVETLLVNNNQATTGFGGDNPILGVILDERTRRPIPIPDFQPLIGAPRRRTTDINYQLMPAAQTRVNTIAVSGIIPSRLRQYNGGIPNFLRLNEFWRDRNLFFGGSMIQLNYSTSATGPFFQQSFEPPNLVAPDSFFPDQGFDFFAPPSRRFGYDVALQVARRVTPVSSRFESPSQNVSELLRELPPQDPYVRRLRCALQASIPTEQLDATAVLPNSECDAFD